MSDSAAPMADASVVLRREPSKHRARGRTVCGCSIRADVRIVVRGDHACRTTPILAGLEPLVDKAI